MIRHFYVVCVIFIAFVVVGCGSVGKSIVAKQEWSENYAADKEVKATSPEMIDGQLSTIGETQTPADSAGTTALSEVIVELPETKSIRRIVLHTPNIRSFSVYAAVEDKDDWKLLEEVKNNEEEKIAMDISAVTDKIKITVRKTSDDTTVSAGGRSYRRRMRYAKGKIREIEIYGLVEEGEGQIAEQTVAPGTPDAPIQKAAEKPKPKAPPAVPNLESPQSTYLLSGPIPVKISLKIGPDDLVVLEDSVGEEMLRTKLLIKTAAGEKVKCSKPTPPIANPRPYRGAGREVNVRNAKTLDADSVITVDISDLLEYYPIKAPGNYTLQLDMGLEAHDKFVGRSQTQIDDLERTIHDVNSKSNYSQTEKAGIIQGLRDEIRQLEKKKGSRYLVVGAKGKLLDLKSNVLELTIQ